MELVQSHEHRQVEAQHSRSERAGASVAPGELAAPGERQPVRRRPDPSTGLRWRSCQWGSPGLQALPQAGQSDCWQQRHWAGYRHRPEPVAEPAEREQEQEQLVPVVGRPGAAGPGSLQVEHLAVMLVESTAYYCENEKQRRHCMAVQEAEPRRAPGLPRWDYSVQL
jgi:hypothetical protein